MCIDVYGGVHDFKKQRFHRCCHMYLTHDLKYASIFHIYNYDRCICLNFKDEPIVTSYLVYKASLRIYMFESIYGVPYIIKL